MLRTFVANKIKFQYCNQVPLEPSQISEPSESRKVPPDSAKNSHETRLTQPEGVWFLKHDKWEPLKMSDFSSSLWTQLATPFPCPVLTQRVLQPQEVRVPPDLSRANGKVLKDCHQSCYEYFWAAGILFVQTDSASTASKTAQVATLAAQFTRAPPSSSHARKPCGRKPIAGTPPRQAKCDEFLGFGQRHSLGCHCLDSETTRARAPAHPRTRELAWRECPSGCSGLMRSPRRSRSLSPQTRALRREGGERAQIWRTPCWHGLERKKNPMAPVLLGTP